MSLLGKILAVLNFLGVVCLFFLIGMGNLKREAWSRSVRLHKMAEDGLPLDDKDRGVGDKPRFVGADEPLNASLLNEHFYGRGGKPEAGETLPRTQSEAVAQLRKKIADKIDAQSAPRDRVEMLCRVQLPLADSFTERDRLLTLHTYLAADPVNDRLRLQIRKAIVDAVAERQKGKKDFAPAFREKMQAISAGPSKRDLADAVLKALPAGGDESLLNKASDAAAQAPQEDSPSLEDARFQAFMRTVRQVDAGSGDALLAGVYPVAAQDLLLRQMARAVRPALLAMRDPNVEAGPNANLANFYVFRDSGGKAEDPSEDRCREVFLAAHLAALDAEPGDPKGPYGEALFRQGFADANFKNALLEAARNADWPGTGKGDEAAPGRRPEVVFLQALAGEKADDPVKLVSPAFERALDGLAGDLRERFEGHFRDRDATAPFTGGPFLPKASAATRRAAAARLLANLGDVAAELDGKDNAPDADGYTPALWRATKVTGLRTMNAELARQYAVTKKLTADTAAAAAAERDTFVRTHARLLELVRERAHGLGVLKGHLAMFVDQNARKESLINSRKKDKEFYEEEMRKETARTATALQQLETMSRELYEIRVKVRDATRLNQEYLEAIKALEEQRRP
jgi:hypothetical protein